MLASRSDVVRPTTGPLHARPPIQFRQHGRYGLVPSTSPWDGPPPGGEFRGADLARRLDVGSGGLAAVPGAETHTNARMPVTHSYHRKHAYSPTYDRVGGWTPFTRPDGIIGNRWLPCGRLGWGCPRGSKNPQARQVDSVTRFSSVHLGHICPLGAGSPPLVAAGDDISTCAQHNRVNGHSHAHM